MQTDKAGKEYWDAEWAIGGLPDPVAPRGHGFATRVDRAFHAFFQEVLGTGPNGERSVLEIGCARSVWLPYFQQEFGLQVHGLDYSEGGCEASCVVLARSGVEGTVHHGDLFHPTRELAGRFDVVVSFGVVEHFADTTGAIASVARHAKPGGTVCTLIPNMTGLVGHVQKLLNPDVYAIHVPLSRETLAAAHRAAGLEVVDCRYLLLSNLSVVNASNLRERRPTLWRGLMRLISLVDRSLHLLERVIPFVAQPNAFTSPYVACHARLPLDGVVHTEHEPPPR